MNDLDQLLAQRADLDARIAAAQLAARDGAIAQVRELMARHGLTMADVTARPAKATRPTGSGKGGKGGKVPAKYRDANGNAWSGRGLQPKWLSAALAGGAKLADFAV